MFSNVEKKLKFLAGLIMAFGIFLAIFFLIIFSEELNTTIGFFIGLISFFTTLTQSWFIYAFAELLENSKEINCTLKIGYKKELFLDEEEKKQQKEAELNELLQDIEKRQEESHQEK